MSVSSPSTSISSQITIHSVFKADEQQIRDLFHADVYHWTRRARPILFNGILSLFKIPICVWLSITIGVGLCHDVNLAKWLVWALALILLVLFISKLLLSSHQIFRTAWFKLGELPLFLRFLVVQSMHNPWQKTAKSFQ